MTATRAGVARASARAVHADDVGDRRPAARGALGKALVPYAVGLASAALIAGGFGFGVHLPNLHNGLLAAAFMAVGLFVVERRPGNREGMLFIATGAAHAVMFFGRQVGLDAGPGDVTQPAVVWATWLGVWPLPLVLALVGVTVMSFPDGRMPSARWRRVATAVVGLAALAAVVSALWPVDYARNDLAVAHPLDLGGERAAARLWPLVGPPSFLLAQAAWVACVVVRLRRARGDEARQLRWFVYGVSMAAVAMAAGLVAFGSPALGVLVAPIIPVAAGAAVLKYRLYDIDVVINKTLVVGTMAAIVTAGYIVVVVGVGGLVGRSAGPGMVLSLVATAVVAVAFDPLRRRVQRRVDRLVYGARPTPYEALARLPADLRGAPGRADVFAGLASTVAAGVGASAVTLWVGSDDELVAVASWPPRTGNDAKLATGPTDLASLAEGGAHVRPIVHQGMLRGAVALTKGRAEVLTASEDQLLHDLAAQAGLVIDNVGLGAELQDRLHQISLQAAELQAAAKRIVAAQDETRRRIERDLHDGAQQRLVTLALSLQAVSDRARSVGDDALAADVEDARRELTQALSELREMARGIHPAILTEEGLEAALGSLAERAPLPVQVDVHLDRRLAQDVEATAYFVVSEALTNAAKHAAASHVVVVGRLHEGRLSVEVTDDGRGGADARSGSGLQGLSDRLATLDGTLTVDSPVGGGTRLRAEVPCA